MLYHFISMIRTQLQVPEEDYEALREVAARQSRSLADCMREAIRLFLRQSRQRADALESIAGQFRPIAAPDDLKAHDKQWADSVMAERQPP